jgi:hypothetical protein
MLLTNEYHRKTTGAADKNTRLKEVKENLLSRMGDAKQTMPISQFTLIASTSA